MSGERYEVGGYHLCPKKDCGPLIAQPWGNFTRWSCPRCGHQIFTDRQGLPVDNKEVLKEAQDWGEA